MARSSQTKGEAGSTKVRRAAQARVAPAVLTAPMLNTMAAMGSWLELRARTHILAAAEKKACGCGQEVEG